MSSRNRDESQLVFYDKNATDNFWVFGLDQGPMLRLNFNVEGDDDDSSHDLNVYFAFSNPLFLSIVPLFSLFVFINKLEDKLFLQHFAETKDISKVETEFTPHTMTKSSSKKMHVW
jgi:hypothetical protein